MSKTNTFENALLLLVFNNDAATGIGDAGGLLPSAAAGSLYVSLHTADPGEAGDQTTNEISYTGYSRVAVARSSAGWTVTGNSVSPASDVDFPRASDGGSATYFGVGTESAGAGKLLYSGAITPAIDCGIGRVPRLTTATAITED